jgi:hypothetical protein
LGPVRLEVDGRAVPIASARQRAVLAALLRSANQVVSISRLIDAVWGECPVRSAQNLVHTYVWRLRTLLGAEGPATPPPGSSAPRSSIYVDSRRRRKIVRGSVEPRTGPWRREPATGSPAPVNLPGAADNPTKGRL